MATIQVPEHKEFAPDEDLTHGVVRARSSVYVIMAVVLAALIGFGVGWLVFRDSGVDVPSEVRELVDGYELATNNADGDAAVEFMTAGGVHVSGGTPAGGLSGDDLADFIDAVPTGLVVDSEYVGVFGDTPYIVVRSATAGFQDGYSVFPIVNEFGELKIASHTWYVT